MVVRTHPALLGIPPAPPADLRRLGACRGKVELFWSEKPQDVAEAKGHCRVCIVRAACLSYALGQTRLYGIWGGMDDDERRQARALPVGPLSEPVRRGPGFGAGLAASGGPVS